MAQMKTKIFAALLGVAVLAAGCVDTVTGRKTAGVPFIKDRIESRYERSVDQVFEAAKQAVAENGVLISEGILHDSNLVKTVEGKVNQRSVWVRVEQVEPRITDVSVQTRTPNGVSDIDLAAQIDKQIALKLVR